MTFISEESVEGGQQGSSTHRHAQDWQRGLFLVSLTCLTLALAAVACGELLHGPRERPGRSEMLTGGGFLGDLPTGGEHGNDKVRDIKTLAHIASGSQLTKALEDGMGEKAADSKKAKAIEAAAAAIAKIMSVPSAQSIVEGPRPNTRSRLTMPDSTSGRERPSAGSNLSSKSIGSSDSSSSGKSMGEKLTPWLKTPKDEGEFTYKHQKLHQVFSACSTRSDYECNDQDTASQAHGWQTTPDRSTMGAGAWNANGY